MQTVIYEGVKFAAPNYVKDITKYHGTTQNHVAAGKLEKEPCEICGNIKSVAHHEIYAKKEYKIRWLCYKHHSGLHSLLRKHPNTEYKSFGAVIQILIPEKFNHRLNVYLLKLKQTGVKKSKAQLILDLAQKGFDNEKRNSEKL